MRAAGVSRCFGWKACLPAAAAAAALAVLTVSEGARAEDTVEDPSDSAEEPKKGDDAKKSKEEPAKDAKEEEAGKEDSYGHGQQGSLRVGLMLGYKMDFRYPNSPFCAEKYDEAKTAEDQIKTCGFGAPPAMDLALGFAIIDAIEPFVFTRFGLTGETRTDTNPLFLLGAGVRIYTMSDSRFKLFFEPAVAYEGEGGMNTPGFSHGHTLEYKKDMVFHLGIGPQFDFAKNFGAYINSGLDVGVLRSISATLLLNIGVQGRLP
jgi:hypothetical protein